MPTTAAVPTPEEFMRDIPESAPDELWNARLGHYYDQYLLPESLKQGRNIATDEDAFRKAVGRPGHTDWPRANVAMHSAIGALLEPVLGLGGAKAQELKHELQRSHAEAVEIAQRQGAYNPLPIIGDPAEFAGSMVGMAPYFTPMGALEGGLAKLGIAAGERGALRFMGASTLTAAMEAAKADPGHRGEAALAGATNPGNLLFALHGLKGAIMKGAPVLGEKMAGAAAETAAKPVSTETAAVANAAVNLAPNLPEIITQHVAEQKQAAVKNASTTPVATTGDPLSVDMTLSTGEKFSGTIANPDNIPTFIARGAEHLDAGGHVDGISGDPKHVNTAYKAVEQANAPKGAYDVPAAPPDHVDLDANAPTVLLRPLEDLPSDPLPPAGRKHIEGLPEVRKVVPTWEGPVDELGLPLGEGTDVSRPSELPQPSESPDVAAAQHTLLSADAQREALMNEEGFSWTKHDSTTVKATGYDPAGQRMRALVKQGDIYEHWPVAPDEYAGLMAAESKGSHYNQFFGKGSERRPSGARSFAKINTITPLDKLQPMPGGLVKNLETGEVFDSYAKALGSTGADVRESVASTSNGQPEGATAWQEGDLYNYGRVPGMPEAGATSGAPGVKPTVLIREADPNIHFEEVHHATMLNLGLDEHVARAIDEHPASGPLFNAFDGKTKAFYAAKGSLSQELFAKGLTAFAHGDEETIGALVDADADRASVAQWMSETARRVYDDVTAMDDTLHKRVAQQQLRQALHRSGGLADLGREAEMFGASVEMRDGQYAVYHPDGRVAFFDDRASAAAHLEKNFGESVAVPDLVDTSMLPEGLTRYALDSAPFSPSRSPIETQPPHPALLRGRQPLTTPMPEGFTPPKRGLWQVGWWFRPSYNFFHDQFTKLGWHEAGMKLVEVENADGALRAAIQPVNDVMEKAFKDIKRNRGVDVMNYLRAAEEDRAATADELHLTPKEVNAAEMLRGVVDQTNLMRKQHGIEGDLWDWSRGFRDKVMNGKNDWQQLMPSNSDAPETAMANYARMAMDGEIDPRDLDAIRVIPAYIEQSYRKSFLEPPLRELGMLANERMPRIGPGEGGGYALGELQPMLKRFVESFRGQPDKSFAIMQGVMNTFKPLYNAAVDKMNAVLPKSLQWEHMEDFDQSALGRFLMYQYTYTQGFRVGPVIRAYSQLLTTGFPMLGSKYMMRGLKESFGEGKQAAWDEAASHGVFLRNQDFRQYIEGTADAGAATPVGGSKFNQIAQASMKMTRSAHNSVRLVSFKGFQAKVADALIEHASSGDWRAFERAADLDFVGDVQKRAFLDRAHQLPSFVGEEARSFAGDVAKELVDQTQWDYTRGGSPGYTKYALGRVFGQYGIWPLSYVEFARKLVLSGDLAQRSARLGRLVASHGSILAAGNAAGIDTSQWVFTNPLVFTGSPTYQTLTNLPKVFSTSQQGDQARRELTNPLWWLEIPGGLEVDKLAHAAATGDAHDMPAAILGLTPTRKGRQ